MRLFQYFTLLGFAVGTCPDLCQCEDRNGQLYVDCSHNQLRFDRDIKTKGHENGSEARPKIHGSWNSSFGLNIKYFSSIEALEIPLEVNVLNLGYNSLSKVPSFEKFPNLVELDLSGNDFEQILDSEFKTLPRLSFKLTPKITSFDWLYGSYGTTCTNEQASHVGTILKDFSNNDFKNCTNVRQFGKRLKY